MRACLPRVRRNDGGSGGGGSASLPIISPNKPKIVPEKRSKIMENPLEVSSLKFVDEVPGINRQRQH